MVRLPAHVAICEVGPRDGLQNERVNVPTAGKVRLIEALAETGLRRMEATSFVSPKWIPNLADAEDVLAGVKRRAGVTYATLVPNLRGLERALAAKVDEVVIFLSASESRNQKNINKSIGQALETYGEVGARAKAAGLRLKAALSTCFGCPYEGDVDPSVVVRIAEALVAIQVDEVGISDTMGMANPRQVYALVSDYRTHSRREAQPSLPRHAGSRPGQRPCRPPGGLTTFDGSVGGLGGCPYAKGATGNVATEDLVHMLHEMGVETGVDLERLIECAKLAQDLVGRPLEGHVAQAGPVHHSGSGRTCG